MTKRIPQVPIRSREFWKGFLIYYAVSATAFLILLFILLLAAASINISKEQTGNLSSLLVFLFKYIFGFPIGFFLDYDSLKGFMSVATLFFVQPLNSFIQFYIISFIRSRGGIANKKPTTM